MEGLLNEFGIAGVWPVLLIALPLGVVGLWVRRRGRARTAELRSAEAARRRLADVAAGPVAADGVWRGEVDGRGVVEEGEHRVLVERAAGAPAIADGTRVMLFGCATHAVDDPRRSSYRAQAKTWVIDVRGDGQFLSARADERERRFGRARRLATAGALLFAAGLATVAASAVIGWRASHDGAIEYGQYDQ